MGRQKVQEVTAIEQVWREVRWEAKLPPTHLSLNVLPLRSIEYDIALIELGWYILRSLFYF